MALYRPHRAAQAVPEGGDLKRIEGGYLLTADLSDGRVIALLPNDDRATLTADGLTTVGAILVQRRRADGSVAETVKVGK